MKRIDSSALARPLAAAACACAALLLAPRAGASVDCGETGRLENTVQLSRTESVSADPESGRSFRVAWPNRSTTRIERADRPVLGGDVRILRCLPEGRWAVVAEGRAERVNGSEVEALVHVEAAGASWASLGRVEEALEGRRNLYPRPMAGDAVIPVSREAKLVARVTPRLTFDSTRLFSGDDLSEAGRALLRSELLKFGNATGRLLVEAHSLVPGDRVALRRATQARAESVAQFVAREMGVDPERVVAMGFGSDGLGAGMQETPTWPAREVNESITLRVLPQ